MLTIKEYAQKNKKKLRDVYRMIERGELKTVKKEKEYTKRVPTVYIAE